MAKFGKTHDGAAEHGNGVKPADIPAFTAIGALILQNTWNRHDTTFRLG